MKYETEQEKFWAGEFGSQYISRNNTEKLLNSKIAMWARMLKSTSKVQSIRELGCNNGLNLLALYKLNPALVLSGYEINAVAAKEAEDLNVATIINDTILKKITDPKVDLTFTAGVLIHINPDHLSMVYENLVNGTSRYILIAEYYNPVPTVVSYRGHADRLFKRDFAGELIDIYGLKLVDYGFIYKRDNWAPQDDINWFLLER